MHHWPLAFFFTAAVIMTASQVSFAEENKSRPNILLIVLDDLGYNDLGANGNPETPTPNLNAFAAQGVRYTRHYADSTCSVARAALLTGTFASTHGFRPNHLGLSLGTPTIASALKQAGYRTQHIGKWHVSNSTLEQSPSQFGFDNWFGFLHQWELRGSSEDGIKFGRPTYIDPWLRANQSQPKQYEGHLEDILTEQAIEFLDRQQGAEQPWFLNLWFYAPHGPIEPATRFRNKHPDTKQGVYYALIDQLDSNIGLVLNALDRNKFGANTLVIILSDNGGTNRHADNNYPYFGKKAEFFEGSFRTPLLMRWPESIKPGGVSNEIVSIHDIFPTIAHASNAMTPETLIGNDLLSDSKEKSPQLYWEWKGSKAYSVLSADGNWRLVQTPFATRILNNLATDPTGTENVIEQFPEIAAKLTADYVVWRKKARVVNFSYQSLNDRGGAVLSDHDLQRSPGYAGFTFAMGITPSSANDTLPQVLIDQAGRWRLEIDQENKLQLELLGKVFSLPALPAGQCSELVISTLYDLSPLAPRKNKALIDIYINDIHVETHSDHSPIPHNWGYANPTYIGISAAGDRVFQGELGHPVILNEYVVPKESKPENIFNSIVDVHASCDKKEDATRNTEGVNDQVPRQRSKPALVND